MKILGCDCGVNGGLAIIEFNDGAALRLIDTIDVPVAGVGAKQRVDPIAMRVWIQTHRPDHAAVERGQCFPKQGISSAFKFGRSCGAIETAIALCNVPLTIAEPAKWKRAFHLHGKDKEGARLLVLQRFPDAHVLFSLNRHHNKAEAALSVTPS
jgi:Holliday junction resolvasome RuvABC endonuclease subunit